MSTDPHEVTGGDRTARSASPVDAPASDVADGSQLPPIVDFPVIWRRLRRSLTVIGAVVLIVWAVWGAVGDGWDVRILAELVGLGLLVSFAVEVVVVGGSAARGLLAAGERGDRLSSEGVSLLPPQVGRRRRG